MQVASHSPLNFFRLAWLLVYAVILDKELQSLAVTHSSNLV